MFKRLVLSSGAAVLVSSLIGCGGLLGLNTASSVELGWERTVKPEPEQDSRSGISATTTEAEDYAILAAALEQVTLLMRNRTAESVDQCGSIGIGHNPRGGPRSYLAFSEGGFDVHALKQAVLLYNGIERELNHKYGVMGVCTVLPPPRLELKDGLCTGSPGYETVVIP
ncbi:MAG: hypothetical protein QGH20_02265 [Candidatus Latescibacteria bacterium]|nr:hypothetical protein [Candidatus Latescibacterota bacterium]